MRKLAWIPAASAVLVLAVVLGSGLLDGLRASAQGMVNFDIDPETTGNSASTLGTVEQDCYEITCPSAKCTWNGSSTFDGVSDYIIDIVVTGDTQAPVAYDASLNYDNTKVHIAPPGTNTVIKIPGAVDLGETGTPPDTDGTLSVGVITFLAAGTPGSGTITRVGLDIGAAGVITFSLNPKPLTSYASDAGVHCGVGAAPDCVRDTGKLAINVDCPVDADNDGVLDDVDLCPDTTFPDPVDANGCSDAQVDGDDDGICDPDAPSAGPSVCTGDDNCPTTYNPNQEDVGDGDGVGDVCDNCPATTNADQANSDADTYGNVCDNCPATTNQDQANSDADSYGNACDNCPATTNQDQANSDTDSYGNVCDNCPTTTNQDQADLDVDGVGNVCDNCPTNANSNQANSDVAADPPGDSYGDVCDNCPTVANEDQTNTDKTLYPPGDALGDACDPDDDNDTLLDDGDGGGPFSNPCEPGETSGCDDNCRLIPNDGQEDEESDGIGNVCELDVNCDGDLDTGDIILMLRYIAEWGDPPPALSEGCPPPAGDLNGPRATAYDDGVDTADLVAMVQCNAGLPYYNIVCPAAVAD